MRDRRGFLVGLGVFGVTSAAQAQSLSDLISGVLNKNKGAATTVSVLGGGVSQSDAATGLKEALRLGATAATNRLGLLDGFFADGKVHIPLPGTLAGVQRNLKPLGLSAPLDDVELKMNRAAEASMPVAKTLFVNAINAITLDDALSILRGGDTAATDFLRGKTSPDLTKLLRPQMDKMLASTGAFTALDRAGARVGQFGGPKVSADLKGQVIDFAVTKALDGTFYYVGEEERAIRKDPVKRTTAILKKVFGAA